MKPILKGILVGIITVTVYLSIVVITTPALLPADAISAAFQLNSPIIIGIGVGVGLQMFLSSYSKSLGCRLDINRKVFGGNSGSTTSTSFFSFFSLIPLGCCGWWLYALSFLPSVFGSTVSAVLIDYSQPLAYLGLVIIFGFNGLTAYKLLKEKKTKIQFFSKIDNKLLHKNYADHLKTECPVCNEEIEPYWEPRYDGVRATCPMCGTNWPES